MNWILVIAIYCAIPELNTRPHDFAKFSRWEDCRDERDRIEKRSHLGVDYVGICEQREIPLPTEMP